MLLPIAAILIVLALAIVTGGHIGYGLLGLLVIVVVWIAVTRGRQPVSFRRRPPKS